MTGERPVCPIAFLNGRFVPAADLTVSATDAGFVSAVTVTDFCRTYRRRLFRWPDHLARFRHDCETLRIPLPYPDADLTAAAERLVSESEGEVAVVTFATPGPLGYLKGSAANGPPTVGMHAAPIARDRYRRFFADGVVLAVVGEYPAGVVPAGVKHRSRLHWWLAEQTVRDRFPGAVAVLTGEGGAADTAVGTVLAVVGDTVLSPDPGAVLAGVSARVVRDLCPGVGLTFADRTLDFRDLPADVSELLLTGSGFGLAGVRTLTVDVAIPSRGRSGSPAGGWDRNFPWPGPAFRRLAAAWSALVGADIAAEFLGGPISSRFP